MNSRDDIKKELENLNSSLSSNINEPVFTVPQDYFENFAATVLARVKAQEDSVQLELQDVAPVLASIPKKMPYSLPENYFSDLIKDVPAFTAENDSPVLAELSKAIPYEVPANYFDNLSNEIVSKLPKKQAKVVSFNRTRWMRIAAAAMVAGIITISGFFYFGNNTVDPETQSEAWVQKKLQGISNQELEDFIQSADFKRGRKVTDTKTEEVRELLVDVSNKELDQFLAQIPTGDEELMVIN